MIDKRTLDLLGTIAERDLAQALALLRAAREERAEAARRLVEARDARQRLAEALSEERRRELSRAEAGEATVLDLALASQHADAVSRRLEAGRAQERALRERLDAVDRRLRVLEASVAKAQGQHRALHERALGVERVARAVAQDADDEEAVERSAAGGGGGSR